MLELLVVNANIFILFSLLWLLRGGPQNEGQSLLCVGFVFVV